MYRILIVDDEALTREGIAGGIEWGKIECEKPFLAENGIEATDVIKNYKIDIVITDVKMPGMNGLELAKWVSENRNEINIIIISGYDDFKYVQSALSSGVVSEYILKPTKFDELINAIEKVKIKLTKRQKVNSEYHKAKEVIEDIRKRVLIDNFVFNRIVNSDELKSSLQNPELDAQLHRLTVIKVYNNIANFPNNNRYISDLANAIDKTVNCAVLNRPIGYYVQYEKNEILIYYYSVAKTLNSPEFINVTNKILCKLYSIFKNISCFDIFAGTSGVGSNVYCLRDLYLDAVRQCDVKKQEKFHGSVDAVKAINFYKVLGRHFDDNLRKRDYQAACDEFGELINRISGMSIVYQKSCAIELINHSVTLLGEQSTIHLNMQKAYEKIIRADRSEGIVAAVRETLQNLCVSPDIHATEINTNVKLSETIIQYINQNFFNDLTLEQVAEKFYISPGHLCRLLRQDANKTFLDILTEVRIENAKVLLKDQKLKIYEVGSMVGFEDSKYFSQVFKRYTGYTPSEYRKGCEK